MDPHREDIIMGVCLSSEKVFFLRWEEREREHAQVKEGQRGRQNPKQAPGSELSAQSPNA